MKQNIKQNKEIHGSYCPKQEGMCWCYLVNKKKSVKKD